MGSSGVSDGGGDGMGITDLLLEPLDSRLHLCHLAQGLGKVELSVMDLLLQLNLVNVLLGQRDLGLAYLGKLLQLGLNVAVSPRKVIPQKGKGEEESAKQKTSISLPNAYRANGKPPRNHAIERGETAAGDA